jgi:large repetitive protein
MIYFLRFLLIISLVTIVQDVFSQCTANAGPNQTICQGQSVTIGGNPTGTGPSPTYSWDNGAGTTANPTVSPNTTTTYTVTVTSGACVETDQMTVTVLNTPSAVVNFSQPNPCSSSPVQFTSNVSACPSCVYQWNFDNPASGANNTSSLPNPSHLFISNGSGTQTFNVTLTITAANGCSNTYTVPVTVSQSPNAVLTEDANFTQCLGLGEFYAYVTNASTPGTNSNYLINWGDGSPNYNSNVPPSGLLHIYTGINIWTLTYTVTGTNGCIDTETYEVSNITNPAIGAATLGNTQQCGPVEMCFNLSGYAGNHPSTQYIVNYGDGSPTQTYNHPPPAQVCHTYTTSSCPGSYTFSITADNNCTPSIVTISPIQIYTPPQAAFTGPPAACAGSNVTFTNTSFGGFNQNCSSAANYVWNFGDPASGANNTSTGVNGTHVYASPGTYTVTLTASNGGNPALSCGSSTFQQNICIETPPTPQFTIPSPGCVNFSANTVNTSLTGTACNVTTAWTVTYSDLPCAPNTGNFQYTGGTSASSNAPQFNFQSAGVYTVNLNMTNTCGTFTDSEIVTVNTIPTVNINPITNICAGQTINPTALTNGCNLSITNYAWSFPGGSPATANTANPGTITYNTPGNYTVTLTITNACGTATSTEPFTVEGSGSVAINANTTTICAGQSANLTASGANTYTWTNTPGLSTLNGANTIASPTVTTTYTVTGTTSAGCPSTASITINVNPVPTVSIPAPPAICAGQSAQLNPTVGGGTPSYSYSWTNGATLSQTNILNPIASPLTTTTYNLTVTDSQGCTATASVTVTVNPLPNVNAGPDITLCNQPVAEQLSGYSPTTGGTGVWTGTGITNGATGQFTPPGVGTFTLTYTFTNSTTGCTQSDVMVVTVINPVTANAGPDLTVCQNSPALQLVPVTAGGTWSGTNVTAGGLFTPALVQTYTLTYSIGGGSCLTTDQIQIVVNPLPVVNAGADLTLCAGASVQLNGSVNGGTMPYASTIWTPNVALSANNILNPTATPASNQNYTLSVLDANNCQASDAVSVTVNPLPVVNAGPDITLCDQPIAVQLAGFSPAGGTWSGTGITNTTTGQFTPPGEGSYNVTYSFTNANGCTNTDLVVVTVTGLTQANAGPDLDLCLNSAAVQLAAGGTWSGNNVTAGGLFTPASSGSFNLTYTIGTGTCQTSDNTTITVYDLPTANAGPDLSICAQDILTLTGSGSSANPPIVSLVWSGNILNNLGNGVVEVSPAATSNYTLTVTDSEGCQATDVMTVTVSSLPVINAGPDVVLCNQPIAEILTGAIPAGGSWSGTGITNSTTGEFTPNSTGSFVITYTYTDAGGCTNSDNLSVTVNNPVITDAGADVVLCLNEPLYQLVGFTPATGGTWSGNGISNASNGIFNAGNAGVGQHILTLQNGQGTCFTQDQLTIDVLALPVVDAGTNEVFCGNDGIVNLSAFNPAGGIWEGPGIVNSSTGTFDTGIGTGAYDIFYWFTDPITGCADTSFKVINVSPVPVSAFTVNPQACTNSTLVLSNISTGATIYSWDFGNTETSGAIVPSYTYPSPGNYTITLTATNNFGCSDISTETAEAIHPPVADFSLPVDEGCAPLVVTFENNSQGDYLSYFWDLSISTTNEFEPAPLTYQQGDVTVTYPVSLTATNYCGSNTVDSEVTVFPIPVVQFGTDLDVFCSPFSVAFNNLTVGEPTSILWDFGDGTTANTFNVSPHVYTTDVDPTNYIITLTATNDCGTDTEDYTITVLPNTVTAFFNTDITFGCPPLDVQFTSFSSGATEYYYSFGDALNSGSNNPNATFTYTQSGTYTASLFADNGCSFDTISVQIIVFESPELTFTSQGDFCFGGEIQFINTSPAADGYTWNFGDGNTSSETSPSHTYAAPGDYTVSLIGQSLNDECGGLGQQIITVDTAPIPSFTVPNQVGCTPFTVDFTNTTVAGNFYEWSFGDGNTAGITNPTHTFYNNTGQPILFPVTLTATNLNLCEAEFTFNIIVSPAPVADFVLSEYETCFDPASIDVVNLSQYANNYQWTWSQGGTSSFNEPTMNFNGPGTYQVQLTASNSYGCTDTEIQQVVVYPEPQALFEPAIPAGCPPFTTSFNNLSVNADNFQWIFSNGQTSDAFIPYGTFYQTGSYSAILIASNEYGCADTLNYTNVVTVHPVPLAAFTYTPDNPNSQNLFFEFQNQSIGATYYQWTFANSSTTYEINPDFTFPDGGNYQVSLIAVNEFNCWNETMQTIVIPEDFYLYVPNAFTPDGDGINDVFHPVVGGSNLLNYEFAIFDRYGEIMFITQDRNESWPGNFRKGDYYVKEEVYNWQVKVRYISNGEVQKETFRGHVTVLW